MITIISGTNRPNSNTLKVAKQYAQLMEKQGVVPKLLSLEVLPVDIAFNELFNKRSVHFQEILDEYIISVPKFVIVSPEYNGSFPGILKIFLDAIHPDINRNKKAALVGVSAGRAGNLRGMDHLTGILHYLEFNVMANKLPVSNVFNLLDEQNNIKDEIIIKSMEKHISEVLKF